LSTQIGARLRQTFGPDWAVNAELYQTMKAVPSLLGMGTTVAGLLLSATRALWFNVGDSRIYRLHRGRLDQLSIDDVPPGPRSGLITQTLGGAPIFFQLRLISARTI
jgi:serine/threonine protein phosphatase PrpC